MLSGLETDMPMITGPWAVKQKQNIIIKYLIRGF